MRKELAKAAGAEHQNASAAQQISEKMKQLGEQASQLQNDAAGNARRTPRGAEGIRAFRGKADEAVGPTRFDRNRPRSSLTRRRRRSGNSKASVSIRNSKRRPERLKALEESRKQLNSNANEALENLRKEIAKQEAGEVARDLKSLQETMAELQKELQKLENTQSGAMDESHDAKEAAVPELTKKQEVLEQQEAGPLAEAGELLQHERPRHMGVGVEAGGNARSTGRRRIGYDTGTGIGGCGEGFAKQGIAGPKNRKAKPLNRKKPPL